jgi:acetylornithine deacetylase
MSFPIDREYLLTTLVDLVKINSINSSLVPGAAGEAEIAVYIADSLTDIGLEVTSYEPEPGRVTVVGKLKGTGSGPSLMLNAHSDTVGVEDMSEPFSAQIREGKMYGRGAYDMKGSLAACMTAAKALVDSGTTLEGDLLVAAVADEEHASIGTSDLIEHCMVRSAIVTEPTELQICLAHKGFVWVEVETHGRAAHGSRVEEGIDANMRMGRLLIQLDELEKELSRRKGHPLLGPPSLHAAKICGGTALSVYAANCQLQIERRTLPGESEAQVIGELRAIVDRLAQADSTFRAKLRTLLAREPFEVSAKQEIVRRLSEAAASVLGKPRDFVGQTPWMDAALLSAAGVDTVVIGPSGGGAHSREEWVDLESVVSLSEILALTAFSYCRSI